MEPIKITQKFIKSAISESFKQEIIPSGKISDAAQEFVNKLSNSTTKTIENFLHTQTRPVPLRAQDSTMYRYNNLLLYRTNGYKSENLEQNLRMLEKDGIAPKFVKYFKLGNDDFLTVMEVEGEKLIPYFKVADKVPQKTKQNFETQIRNLINGGILNREIFANQNPLFITPDAQKIVYADWAETSPLLHSERAGILNKIQNWHI